MVQPLCRRRTACQCGPARVLTVRTVEREDGRTMTRSGCRLPSLQSGNADLTENTVCEWHHGGTRCTASRASSYIQAPRHHSTIISNTSRKIARSLQRSSDDLLEQARRTKAHFTALSHCDRQPLCVTHREDDGVSRPVAPSVRPPSSLESRSGVNDGQ